MASMDFVKPDAARLEWTSGVVALARAGDVPSTADGLDAAAIRIAADHEEAKGRTVGHEGFLRAVDRHLADSWVHEGELAHAASAIVNDLAAQRDAAGLVAASDAVAAGGPVPEGMERKEWLLRDMIDDPDVRADVSAQAEGRFEDLDRFQRADLYSEVVNGMLPGASAAFADLSHRAEPVLAVWNEAEETWAAERRDESLAAAQDGLGGAWQEHAAGDPSLADLSDREYEARRDHFASDFDKRPVSVIRLERMAFDVAEAAASADRMSERSTDPSERERQGDLWRAYETEALEVSTGHQADGYRPFVDWSVAVASGAEADVGDALQRIAHSDRTIAVDSAIERAARILDDRNLELKGPRIEALESAWIRALRAEASGSMEPNDQARRMVADVAIQEQARGEILRRSEKPSDRSRGELVVRKARGLLVEVGAPHLKVDLSDRADVVHASVGQFHRLSPHAASGVVLILAQAERAHRPALDARMEELQGLHPPAASSAVDVRPEVVSPGKGPARDDDGMETIASLLRSSKGAGR